MAFRATAYQQALEDGGIEPEVAKAHTRAAEEFFVGEMVTREYLDARLDQLRSEFKTDFAELRSEVKSDITGLRSEMNTKVAELRSEVKTDIAALETRLVRWIVGSMVGLVVTMTTIMVAVLRIMLS